jgi:HEAT repeat protein
MFRWLKLKRCISRLGNSGLDSDKRVAAADALGKLGDPRAVEPLVSALGDDRAGVRCAAAEALGKLSDTRAIEPLIKALGDGDYDVRGAAAGALGKLGDARAIESLISALGDGENGVRRAAADALGKLGDKRAVDSLVRALADREAPVRRAAVESLAGIGDVRATEPLVSALRDSTWNVQCPAARALCLLGDERGVKFLLEELRDSKHGRDSAAALVGAGGPALERLAEVRLDLNSSAALNIVAALAATPDARAVPLLIGLLVAEDPDVRRGAAVALGKLGEPKWIYLVKGSPADLLDLGHSGDERVVAPLVRVLGGGYALDWRVHAAVALGTLGDSRAVVPLIACLGDTSSSFRREAASALGRVGERKLSACVRGEDSDFLALGNSGDVRVLVPLVKALRSGDWRASKGAADALYLLGVLLGDVNAVGPLIETVNWALRADNHEQRHLPAVVRALCKLGGQRALEPLSKAFDHALTLDAMCAVTECLYSLGDRRGVEVLTRRLDSYDWQDSVVRTIAPLPHAGAVDTLVEMLTRGGLRTRRAAATVLIKWAKLEPALFLGRWKSIAASVSEPHEDDLNCSTSVHRDTGIGLDFPDPPAGDF